VPFASPRKCLFNDVLCCVIQSNHSPNNAASDNSDTNNPSSQQCQLKRTTSTNSTYQMSTTRKYDSQGFLTRRLTCVLVLVTAVFEISFFPYLVVVSIPSHTPDYFSKLSESQQKDHISCFYDRICLIPQ